MSEGAYQTGVSVVTRRWWRIGAVVGLWWLSLCWGCGNEAAQVWLEPIDPPPGGMVATVVSLQAEQSRVLIAPAPNEIYVRDVNEPSWQRVDAHWPAQVEDPGLAPLEMVARPRGSGGFVSAHYFAAFQGVLWAVALPAAGRDAILLKSRDLGQTWQSVTLPDDWSRQSEADVQRSPMAPSMRLIEAHDRLYLTDGFQLWQALVPAVESESDQTQWEPVSLAGIPVAQWDRGQAVSPVEGEAVRGRIPLQLRHYLPADDDDADELATAYGRGLKVFRRGPDDEAFEQIATVEGMDTDLRRSPGGETLYLVDAQALYRSEDGGHSWTALEVGTDSLAPEDYRRVEIAEVEASQVGYELWLMGSAGSLWRSDDGGDSWEEVLGRDADGRAANGMVRDEQGQGLWVATAGRGMLRSRDRGQTWQITNAGLRGATIYHAILRGDQRMYVGTDAGLFDRATDARREDWSRIDHRSTSAMWMDDDGQRIIRGTSGGAIVVGGTGREEESSEALPLGEGEEIEFILPHQRGRAIERSAVMSFEERPDSRDIVAWSHRQGPMISNDAGASWRRMRLSEAFRNTMAGSVITGFTLLREQTYFVVTRSRRDDEPTQLWRSRDGGQTWQATYSLMEQDGKTAIQLLRLPGEGREGILMAHGSRVAISTDMGDTWATLSGPWQGATIKAMGVDRGSDQVVVVMKSGHITEIAWLDNLREGGQVVRRFNLNWPQNHGVVGDRPVGLTVWGDEVLIHDQEQLYSTTGPRRSGNGTGNVSLVIAFGALLVLTTMAFGYLRTWESISR